MLPAISYMCLFLDYYYYYLLPKAFPVKTAVGHERQRAGLYSETPFPLQQGGPQKLRET